jgi:predicted transcriptional regulator
MQEQSLEALMVVDEYGRSLGVVDRTQVLSKMLAVTAASSG